MKKYLLLFLAVLLAPSYSLAAVTASVTVPGPSRDVSLSITSSSGTYGIGSIFQANITLNTGGAQIEGVDVVYLNYNPSYLEVQDADGSVSGVQITPGSLMSNTVANSVSGGQILFSQTTSGGSSYSGSGTLASVSFRVLREGSTSLSFDFSLGSTIDTNAAGNGQDLLGSVSGATFILSANPNPTPTPNPTPEPDPTPAPTPTPTPAPSSGGGGNSGGGTSIPAPASTNTPTPTSSNTSTATSSGLSEGSVVKIEGDPKIYIIEGGVRKHIPSAEEFNKRGLSWGSIQTVSSSELSSYQEVAYSAVSSTTPTSNTSSIANGSVVKMEGDPKIYVIENGVRKHIPSAEEFTKRGFSWSAIQIITGSVLNTYPEESYFSSQAPLSQTQNSSVAAGSLIKFNDSPKVYVVVGGEQQIVHIPTYQAFVAMGFDFANVQNKDAGQRSNYKITLLVKSSGPEVYYLDPNKKIRKHIKSPEVFNSYSQNKWSDILTIEDKYVGMYNDAKLIKLQDDEKVYFLDGNTKKHITSAGVFTRENYDWNDIITINSFEMGTYQEGSSLN